MEVINVLPTPVAIIPCPFHGKVKETILAEIEEQKQNQITYSANSEQLKHIGHYSVLHNDERYGRFRNWCEQQAELYAKEVKGDYIQETVQVTDSWINISDKGGYQYPHHHANSYLSAIYYVNFDMARDHVPTYFTRDTNFINAPSLNFITGKITDYNQNNEVLSNEGELVIFPSQLNHGYDENTGYNLSLIHI